MKLKKRQKCPTCGVKSGSSFVDDMKDAAAKGRMRLDPCDHDWEQIKDAAESAKWCRKCGILRRLGVFTIPKDLLAAEAYRGDGTLNWHPEFKEMREQLDVAKADRDEWKLRADTYLMAAHGWEDKAESYKKSIGAWHVERKILESHAKYWQTMCMDAVTQIPGDDRETI